MESGPPDLGREQGILSGQARPVESAKEASGTPSLSSMAQEALIARCVDEIWPPIKKRLRYCFDPETLIRKMDKYAADLKDTIDIVQEKIQEGERAGKRPRTQTIDWIERAQSANGISHRIKNDYEGRRKHAFGCSLDIFFNYRISSAATKELIDVDEIMKRRPQNDTIFTLLPPVGREIPLPPNIVGQNEYKDKIIGYIKQGAVGVIGICGMGGSGKTTLLKQLNNIFSCTADMCEYEHVIYVEVGQQPDLKIIQQKMASQLGLTLAQSEDPSVSIHNFLKERKFLLLIDDLWKTLDLVKVGIQYGSRQIGPQNRQTIIITTRQQEICRSMKVDEVIFLQRLDSNEAWSLFEANAGNMVNSNAQIRSYATKIVEKCGGLPLALKIVGQAMASKEREDEWEYVMMLLQNSQFHEIPDAESDLFPVLYFSYRQLPDERTKQCFLLFALESYYKVVSVLNTIDLWTGHGLLDDDIESNHLRGRCVVECLKRACLLEEKPPQTRFLGMHDVVRDLAFWIVEKEQGSKKWLVSDPRKLLNPECVSSAERIHVRTNSLDDIPASWSTPCLLTLILRNSRFSKLPAGFFGAAPSLTYLDLSYTKIQELPPDVGALVNLQHLDLTGSHIRSLPVELQQLSNLRYLYLRHILTLKTIPAGTISALSMLKVLNMFSSAPFPKQKNRAYIDELESLASLQSLGFTIADFDSFRRIFKLSRASLSSLEICYLDGLKCLHASPIESLESIQIDKIKAQKLEILQLTSIESMEELVIGETNVESDWHFQSLAELRLAELTNLVNITWKGLGPSSFLPKLRVLLISDCHSIKAITWIEQLPCLEEVYLAECRSLLELASNDEEGTMSSARVSFPRLRILGLCDLGNLKDIISGTITFQCLQRLLVYKCPIARLPSKIASGECVPMILGEQTWWDELCWEDTGVKSVLSPFFRELPEGFEGTATDVYRALQRGWML